MNSERNHLDLRLISHKKDEKFSPNLLAYLKDQKTTAAYCHVYIHRGEKSLWIGYIQDGDFIGDKLMHNDTTPTTEIPITKPTKNVLHTLQIVALHGWVQAHAEDCRNKTDAKLAAHATLELNFTVTAHNIGNMRGELGFVKAAKEVPATLEQQVGELRGLYELQKATMLAFGLEVDKLNRHCFGEREVKDHPELGLDTDDGIDRNDGGGVVVDQ